MFMFDTLTLNGKARRQAEIKYANIKQTLERKCRAIFWYFLVQCNCPLGVECVFISWCLGEDGIYASAHQEIFRTWCWIWIWHYRTAIHPFAFYHCFSCTPDPGSCWTLLQQSWGDSRVEPLTSRQFTAEPNINTNNHSPSHLTNLKFDLQIFFGCLPAVTFIQYQANLCDRRHCQQWSVSVCSCVKAMWRGTRCRLSLWLWVTVWCVHCPGVVHHGPSLATQHFISMWTLSVSQYTGTRLCSQSQSSTVCPSPAPYRTRVATDDLTVKEWDDVPQLSARTQVPGVIRKNKVALHPEARFGQ